MDWSERINLAIEYIEKNLKGELNVDEAAKVACSSSYHFQRMFFAIIGITPAEYARRRKLTMAATELMTGHEKVIDIALKYGYESPNAFTRAFRNMHGITPREARSSGVKLSVYHRVSLNIQIKGGNNMHYRIIEKPAFMIVGKSKKFSHEYFFKEAPKFWKGYVGTKRYQSLLNLTNGQCGPVAEAPLMSIYLPDESGDCDIFTDILGVEKSTETEHKNFELFEIPAATYAEFNCTYQTAAKTNKYIYGEWFPSTGHERDGNKADIAAYFPLAFRPMKEMKVRWWIPLQGRSLQ